MILLNIFTITYLIQVTQLSILYLQLGQNIKVRNTIDFIHQINSTLNKILNHQC